MEIRKKPQVKFSEKKVQYSEKHTDYDEKKERDAVSEDNNPPQKGPNKTEFNENKAANTIDNQSDPSSSLPITGQNTASNDLSQRIINNTQKKNRQKRSVLYTSKTQQRKSVFNVRSQRTQNSAINHLYDTALLVTSSINRSIDTDINTNEANNKSESALITSASQKVITGITSLTKKTIEYGKKKKAPSNSNESNSSLASTKNEKDKNKKSNNDTASNLIKEAGKAIKRLITFILSFCSPIVFCVFIMAIVLVIAVSVFGIFFSNKDDSLTNAMNEIVAEYKDRIESIKNDVSYDTLSIEGEAPEWKQIIMAYCGKYSSAAAGSDQQIFAEFNDASKEKLKKVFWGMVTISKDTEVKTIESTDSEGKTTTTKQTKLIITIDSLTALEYAEKEHFNEEQIENIKMLNQVSDETWNSLLEKANSFSLLGSGGFVGDWVYYDQTQYGNSYGDDSIAGSGCGPTSLAMVATYLTASSITPVDAIWCGNSYYVYGVGTSWSYFAAAADHFGFRMEGQTSSWSTVIDALKNGKPVISAQRPGIFTRGGHFIVLAGLDSNDNVIVYDPNGGNGYNPDGKGATFTQAQVSASGTQYWIFDSDLNQGGNVAELAWRYLRNAGLSKQAAAGVIGNMMIECGGRTLNLDPTLYDEIYGTHYGLCQWDIHLFPSIQNKNARGQLEYLCNEYMGAEINSFGWLYRSGFTLDEFKNMTNVENAAVAFAMVCERPGYEYNNYQWRREAAMVAYNHFKDK